jgi:hypothetical protein
VLGESHPSLDMPSSSGFTQMFGELTGSAPARPTSALDSVRSRMSAAVSPAASSAQAMQATVLPGADSLCPKMSFKDRVRGCIGCMCAGMGLSLLGFFAWIGEDPRTRPAPQLAASCARPS